MRKLNGKNKIFIAIFSIIVSVMIVILVVSVFITQKNGKTVYKISSNSVVFDSETNLVDTTSGGEIYQRWNGSYYYLNKDENSFEIGNIPVVYEKSKDTIEVFGTIYQVLKDGSVLETEELTEITDYTKTFFYKLEDRKYLIVAPEVYTADKAIYASKYLIVYIDKKGNASVLNDSLNVKTINPISLVFDGYTFDIANEKLIAGKKTIDLKQINGSTNEYAPKKTDPNDYIDLDYKELAEQYNTLVNSFEQYVQDSSAFIGSANQIFTNNNFLITESNKNNNKPTQTTTNLTNITKMVSLRGAISKSTHIDVTYSVSDVADQFHVVYLLVTGVRNGQPTTEKIILDKYKTTHRVTGLSPRYEYTISLAYIERVKNIAGEYILQDQIEDVINVRTTAPEISLTIDKISKGYAYFTFKMQEEYALTSGSVALYIENEYITHEFIDMDQALKKNGFQSKIKLSEGSALELRLENAIYNKKSVELDIKQKFTY